MEEWSSTYLHLWRPAAQAVYNRSYVAKVASSSAQRCWMTGAARKRLRVESALFFYIRGWFLTTCSSVIINIPQNSFWCMDMIRKTRACMPT